MKILETIKYIFSDRETGNIYDAKKLKEILVIDEERRENATIKDIIKMVRYNRGSYTVNSYRKTEFESISEYKTKLLILGYTVEFGFDCVTVSV